MKLTLERAALGEALAAVTGIVERRNTIPILSNILIEGDAGGTVTMMATDLDLQVVRTFAAQVDQAGATTVSAYILHDITRKLGKGAQVSLSVEDRKLQLISGRARFNLQMLPRDDFPVIATGDLPVQFDMPAAVLREVIDAVRHAISTEETRYYLNGIFAHVTAEGLKFATTDGHRLARVTVERPDGLDSMPDVIIPRKAVGELRKLIDGCDGAVSIRLSNTKIEFDLGDTVLTSKLIDGTFPDYSRVIPTGNDKLLKIDPAALSEAVARVATVASEKTRAVKLALDQDRVTVTVTSPENGTASEEVPCDYRAAPFEIGFNAQYLTTLLDLFGEDPCEVHLADGAAPTLLRQNAASAKLFVLMPMRV